MRANKLKLLTISLFLNNIKSVRIQHSNGQPYKYKERNPNSNIIQENNRQSVNGTILEYMINQDIEKIRSDMLASFIAEIQKLPYKDTIFTIQNNLDIYTYEVTKQNNLTKIERIAHNNIQAPDTIYDSINYTVLALSYMHSPIMQLFFENNTAKDKNTPNSGVFIVNGFHLVMNHTNHCYYMFQNNIVNDMRKRQEIEFLLKKPEEENKTTTCYDKFKEICQTAIPILNLAATIIVPLAGKKVKEE